MITFKYNSTNHVTIIKIIINTMNPISRYGAIDITSCSNNITTYRGRFINVGIIVCVTLGIMLPLACGEVVHLTRDFGYHNSDETVQSTNKAAPIVSDQDAEKFLQHYGYLKCNGDDEKSQSRKRRSISNLLSLTEGDHTGSTGEVMKGCTKLDIVHATVLYQDVLRLPITGTLDTDTKKQMNAARCGDKDDNLVQIEETRLASELTHGKDDPYTPRWLSHADYPESGGTLEENIDLDRRGSARRRRSAQAHARTPFTNPPLEVYTDEHGSVFGREPGQIHLKHHHPVPEGRLDEGESMLEKMLLPNSHQQHRSHHRRVTPQRRQMYDNIKSGYLSYRNNATSGTVDNDDPSDVGDDAEKSSYSGDDDDDYRTLQDKPFVNLDPEMTSQQRRRARRSAEPVTTIFNKDVLIYKLLEGSYSHKIPIVEQCTTISLAFRMWAEVTNVDFQPASSDTPSSDIDIILAFGRNQHLNCIQPFDGELGEFAHTNKSGGVGRIHFDDDEKWGDASQTGENRIPLLLVAVHEIGHVLGLSHLDELTSVMYPTLTRIQNRIATLELTTLDRNAIQALYGQCTGRFDGAFDWLHTNPNRYTGLNCMHACQCDEQVWQYFTYFFRQPSYWLYLNARNRPRYGDPLLIRHEWQGLPSNVDGMTQILMEHPAKCTGKKQTTQFEFQTLFFKNDMVYEYDDVRDIVFDSALISERYPPKAGQTESIPNNIDAAIFDPRNNHLFVFKGEWIYEVDPFETLDKGCCLNKYLFSDLYNSTELTGNVDAGYLRWGEKQVYFYKGDKVYTAELFDNGFIQGYPVKLWQPEVRQTDLMLLGPWNSMWRDICDVVTETYASCTD